MPLLRSMARRATVSVVLLTIGRLAHAQTSGPADDGALTWKGITLYGVVDVGVQYDTHSAPGNNFLTYTTSPLIQKYSSSAITALTSSPLGSSRIGLAGNEPVLGDWSGVFRLETYFNPTSGQITDTLKSIAQNNGVAVSKETSNSDSSLAGEPFATAFVGLSSPTYGSFTFGRQVTVLADGVVRYDPMEDGVDSAHAFSLIGNQRAAGGGGDTEDSRLDDSFKYSARYDWLHVGALYQLSDANGSANTAIQAQLGIEYAGTSIDAYFSRKYDAISATALSAAQVTALPQSYSVSNSLAGTVSDNTAYAIMGLENFGSVKLYAGYEHIRFADPKTPLSPGFDDIGGYVLADVTNNAYVNNKVLQIFWGGGKWYVTPSLSLTAAYYGYRQNSYATGANAGCSSDTVSSCSGSEDVVGVLADYRLSRHCDIYIGGLFSEVSGGLSSGFLNTSTVSTTTGIKFTF
jgi:predicted porin